ncbi:MAG: hypothetical protein JNL50_06895 [Phycisphaerae bacterium]|nr:hypothetical protein [Phycisphaerae bacterium]
MNDLIPVALFVGCLLATLGLVRVCEWLQPTESSTTFPAGGSHASPTAGHTESAR